MQEEGGTRVEEHARQYRYPRKGDEIDREVEPQRQTRQGYDDEDLEAIEENRGCRLEIIEAEDIEINDQQAEEKDYQHCLSEDRKRALFMSNRFIFVRPA